MCLCLCVCVCVCYSSIHGCDHCVRWDRWLTCSLYVSAERYLTELSLRNTHVFKHRHTQSYCPMPQFTVSVGVCRTLENGENQVSHLINTGRIYFPLFDRNKAHLSHAPFFFLINSVSLLKRKGLDVTYTIIIIQN